MTLDDVSIGARSAKRVRRSVSEHPIGDEVLLCMSLLRYFEMSQHGRSLTLPAPPMPERRTSWRRFSLRHGRERSGNRAGTTGDSRGAVGKHHRAARERMALPERTNRVAAEAFSLLRLRYERPVMNNVDRGGFVECMVAALLGTEWGLTWILGDDWLPWDIEHMPSGAKIEVKQSAARQSWQPPNVSNARAPRFDIAPRQQYSPTARRWTGKPARAADLYIFGWHPERARNSLITATRSNGNSSWCPRSNCRVVRRQST